MKTKELCRVISQEMISPDIYSLWIETKQIAAQAKPGQFVALYSADKSRMLPRPISLCEIGADQKSIRLVYRIAGAGTKEFSALPLTHFQNLEKKEYGSISEVLSTYYATRNALVRIRQKSADLRHIVQTALERNRKKYELQSRQLKDTENRELYKVYGELINAYGYQLPEGSKELTALNHYTGDEITIPLDPVKTPQENAQKYFARYNKQKRTYEALTELISETGDEIRYLESVESALDIALYEEDLTQIKEELSQAGYIRRRQQKKKA